MAYQPWCIQYPQLEPTQTRRSPQALEGIPCGLFHNKAVGDTRRLHKNEGIPILPRWSCKGLTVPITGSLQQLERYEAHVLGEILSSIQDWDHQEGNLGIK
ncbi:hypothetical protein CR513_32060, partial [Mucuna pruriens]